MNVFQFYHSCHQAELSPPEVSTGELQLQDFQDIAVWKTCLRKIIFFNQAIGAQNFKSPTIFEFKKEDEALNFLLQVLCGLKSKIFGETEVFGQFKKFIESPEAKKISILNNPAFIQFIFQQVKELRETYITDLGVQSYGSLIRKKYFNQAEITLIGYGHLAQEIIPWIKTKKINVHVRNSSRYSSSPEIRFHPLGQAQMNSVVIIAAPISSADLQTVLADQVVERIIDCRGLDDQSQKSLKNQVHAKEIIELSDLFKLLEDSKSKAEKIRPMIEKDIADRVTRYFLKSYHRPQGWDDLCG